MKKLLLAALLTATSVYSYGQQYEYGPPEPAKSRDGGSSSKVRFGVFIAPNNSWMKPTSNKSNDRQYVVTSEGGRFGYSWGLMVDYYFAENYGIATGFQLNTTGGRILATQNPQATPPTGVSLVNSADFNYKLQFLEIPFALKLRSDELTGGLRVFGQIGVTAGINISKKADYEVIYTDIATPGITNTVTGENEKLQDALATTPVAFQMNLGAGIEYPISGKMAVYGGIFFNNGFAPDATNPKELDMGYKGKFSDGNIRLNSLSFRIGLFF